MNHNLYIYVFCSPQIPFLPLLRATHSQHPSSTWTPSLSFSLALPPSLSLSVYWSFPCYLWPVLALLSHWGSVYPLHNEWAVLSYLSSVLPHTSQSLGQSLDSQPMTGSLSNHAVLVVAIETPIEHSQLVNDCFWLDSSGSNEVLCKYSGTVVICWLCFPLCCHAKGTLISGILLLANALAFGL